jgi:hypothetical protein
MFWWTIRRVFREIRMAAAMREGLVVHQNHIRGLDGGVGAQRAHGDADVGSRQHRRVVDAVAHKGQLSAAGFRGQQLFGPVHLVGGQQLRVVFVHAQLSGNGCRHFLGVTGEHHRFPHAGGFQIRNGGGSVLLGWSEMTM